MAQEAVVRVTLDTDPAKQKLNELYGQMRQSPSIPTGGGGAGGGGGGVGPVGSNGFNVGQLLGSLARAAPPLAFGMPALQDVGSLGGAVFGGAGRAASGALGLSGVAGAARGRQQAADIVAESLGPARGMGLIGSEASQSLYEAISPMLAAQEEGKAQIRAELGASTSSDTLKDLGDRIVAELKNLGRSFDGRSAP